MRPYRAQIETALASPRFRALSLAGRGLYIELLYLASRLKSPEIRFEKTPPSLLHLSLVLSASVSDVRREIVKLDELGLISHSENGTISVLPTWCRRDRFRISVAIGLKSSRPKRKFSKLKKVSKNG
jgi:hypothetical protein